MLVAKGNGLKRQRASLALSIGLIASLNRAEESTVPSLPVESIWNAVFSPYNPTENVALPGFPSGSGHDAYVTHQQLIGSRIFNAARDLNFPRLVNNIASGFAAVASQAGSISSFARQEFGLGEGMHLRYRTPKHSLQREKNHD